MNEELKNVNNVFRKKCAGECLNIRMAKKVGDSG